MFTSILRHFLEVTQNISHSQELMWPHLGYGREARNYNLHSRMPCAQLKLGILLTKEEESGY